MTDLANLDRQQSLVSSCVPDTLGIVAGYAPLLHYQIFKTSLDDNASTTNPILLLTHLSAYPRAREHQNRSVMLSLQHVHTARAHGCYCLLRLDEH